MNREPDTDPQQDLFGGVGATPPLVQPAIVPAQWIELASRVPKNAHLGTSSWSFPGWAGIVYAHHHTAARLARHGLRAYAQHPLLTAANIDSTFYKPQTTVQLARYAAEVPAAFRFVVKAYSGLTTAPGSLRAQRAGIEPVFLDAGFAARAVIEPVMAGLGSKLGAVLFQFSPLGARWTAQPEAFVAALQRFLYALPRGPAYAVELRDPQILGAAYEAALASTGAVHCFSVHARMPPVDSQVTQRNKGPLLIRWLLRPGDDYRSAGVRFAPFNRLLEPDKLSRSRVAGLANAGLSCGRDVFVITANNAEGSAPLTLFELAKTFTVH